MSNVQDLTMFAGETRTLTMHARDASNNVQDLTDLDVSWRAGRWLGDDLIRPVLVKEGTVIDAAAGIFTVTLEPSDTMPLQGNFEHEAFATIDGAIQFVSDSDEDIDFINDDGEDIIFVSDDDGFLSVVTNGVLNIRRSVLAF